MELVKQAILKFYTTHSYEIDMSFDELQKMVDLDRETLNNCLKSLLNNGFICEAFPADNIIYSFRINR